MGCPLLAKIRKVIRLECEIRGICPRGTNDLGVLQDLLAEGLNGATVPLFLEHREASLVAKQNSTPPPKMSLEVIPCNLHHSSGLPKRLSPAR